MSSWRASLRIARRDALRAKGRSLLVVAMIGLPVLGVTAVDVVARTFELSPEQAAERTFGAADLIVHDSGYTAVEQFASDGGWSSESAPRAPGEQLDPAAVLPPGSRVLPDASRDGTVSADGAVLRAGLRALSYDDPLAQGLYTPVSGRAPQRAEEVSLTTGLADRLGLGLGDEVVLDRARPPRTVVGVVADASSRGALTVLLEPGALEGATSRFGGQGGRFLVGLPGEPTWSQVQAVNAAGGYVEAREDVPGAPPEPVFPDDGSGEVIAAIALVVGMALLEVVLLAGPAFAVGAKRSARQLALVAATGGERRDVRRIVLGSGLVLGATGAALGAVGGVALAAAGLPLVARFDDSLPGPFEVGALEVAGIALLGVLTALLAAWLPARTASRQDVVAALTGRRGTVRGVRGLPVIGLVAAVVGAAIAFQGGREREVLVILAGSAIAELGLVAMTPWLVGVTGRLGPLLPVAPRLALRDAARNRGRTAPAVSAILAAVAGTVAVGTFLVSQDDRNARSYTPSAAHGTVVVSLWGESAQRVREAVLVLERELPAGQLHVTEAVGGGSDGAVDTGYVELAVAGDSRSCFYDGPGGARAAACDGGSTGYFSGLLVGDGALLAAVSGVDAPELARVLATGGAVVPAWHLAADGTVTLVVHPPGDHGGTAGREVVVPGAALPPEAFQATVLSPEVAEQLGQPVLPVGAVLVPAGMPSAQQQDRAQGALESLGLEASIYVERGYVNDFGAGLIALALGSGLLVLGASGIATGLAAADGRADLSTLASVGATPGLRRRLAGAQSFVTAGLGTALGVVAGLVPAVGLISALNQPVEGYTPPIPFRVVIPWPILGVAGLVVPLLAVLAAMALTRSRLPLVRRLA